MKRSCIRLVQIASCAMAAIVCFRPGIIFTSPSSFFNKTGFLTMIQYLERTQQQNKAKLIRQINGSLSQILYENITGSKEFVKENFRIITRSLFDNRQGARSSQRAIKRHPFFRGFVIENPDVCKDERVDILVYIHSAPENRIARRYIREGWACSRNYLNINIIVVFILGKPVMDSLQLQIETEYATYGDIVQGNFVDTFKNLTYKAITMLVWVNGNCPQAKYIVKVDDDMFVDMFRVIYELIPKLHEKTFACACDVKTNYRIFRNPAKMRYVNKTLLPSRKRWPTFCAGYFVIMTGEVVPVLFERSFEILDFVPIDDAYLFGLLPEKNISLEYLNIKPQISIHERPLAEEEITINGKFDFISFRVKVVEDHTNLWSLRSTKLLPWERAHSRKTLA